MTNHDRCDQGQSILWRLAHCYTSWNAILTLSALHSPSVFLPWAQWSALWVATVVLDATVFEHFPHDRFYQSLLRGLPYSPALARWVDLVSHYLPIAVLGIPQSIEGFSMLCMGATAWSLRAFPHLRTIYCQTFTGYTRVFIRSSVTVFLYSLILVHGIPRKKKQI